MKLLPGVTLQNGKYLLSQELGGEGIGKTFVANQTFLSQPVVIKTLNPGLRLSHNFLNLRDRFVQQARLLASIQHPSIVRVLDLFREDDLPFLVMEAVPGKPLAHYLAESGKLSEAEAVHYIRQAGSALHFAHQQGLLHQNLKPASILRRAGTNLGVLVGFGLAHDLTETAGRDDLHGLAATLYALLAGRAPTSNLMIEAAPWSPTTKQAILVGLQFVSTGSPRSIEDWLRLLPNTTLPLVGAVPPAPSIQPPIQASTPPKTVDTNGRIYAPFASQSVPQSPLETVAVQSSPKPVTSFPSRAPAKRFTVPKTLVLMIAGATALGAGFGTALRISAVKASGATLLQPSQAFGERDWKGAATSERDPNSSPIEKSLGKFNSKPAPVVSESGVPKPPKSWGQDSAPVAPIRSEPVVPIRSEPVAPVVPQQEVDPIEPAIVREPSIAPVPPRTRPRLAPAIPVPAPSVLVPEPLPPLNPRAREIEPAPPLTSGGALRQD
jgi:serine/threonine-protein kinase